MKGKIVFGLLLVSLIFTSACNTVVDTYGPSDIVCDDGGVVSFSEECGSEKEIDGVVENFDDSFVGGEPNVIYNIQDVRILENIRSFSDYKKDCDSPSHKFYTKVIDKVDDEDNDIGIGAYNCPAGVVCSSPDIARPAFGKVLTIGDGSFEKEYNTGFGSLDEDVWYGVKFGEWYLFSEEDGRIVSAEKSKSGRTYSEYKIACSIGPSTFKGKITDMYVCTSPGEGVVYKCDGPNFVEISHSGESGIYKTTFDPYILGGTEFRGLINGDVFKKMGVGQEYIFTLWGGRIADAFTEEDYIEKITHRPSDELVEGVNLFRVKEGNHFTSLGKFFSVKDVGADGIVVISSGEESSAISPGSSDNFDGVTIRNEGVGFGKDLSVFISTRVTYYS